MAKVFMSVMAGRSERFAEDRILTEAQETIRSHRRCSDQWLVLRGVCELRKREKKTSYMQCCHSVGSYPKLFGFLTLKFSVWILSKTVGFFIIRKLFDISCISDHVQPISKPLSVVLAECGHFVVTWSVQEYSCTVLCSPRSVQEYACRARTL